MCVQSVLEDAKPYARMKLMIVGVQGIGKTSLLEQLRAEGTGSYKKRPPEVSRAPADADWRWVVNREAGFNRS